MQFGAILVLIAALSSVVEYLVEGEKSRLPLKWTDGKERLYALGTAIVIMVVLPYIRIPDLTIPSADWNLMTRLCLVPFISRGSEGVNRLRNLIKGGDKQ